jgi:hypothetical protein
VAAERESGQQLERKADEILPAEATDGDVENLGAATVGGTHVLHEPSEARLDSLADVDAVAAQTVDGVDDTAHLQRTAGPLEARLIDASSRERNTDWLNRAPEFERNRALGNTIVELLVLLANGRPAEARGAGRGSGRLKPLTMTETTEGRAVVDYATTMGSRGKGRDRVLDRWRRHQTLEISRRSSVTGSGVMERSVVDRLSSGRWMIVTGFHPACL